MTNSMTFAITVHSHYLDPKTGTIKLMSIVRTKTGVFIWHTKRTLFIHHELYILKSMAIEYSLDSNIPYIYALKQGLEVSPLDQQTVEKHFGSKLSDLI